MILSMNQCITLPAKPSHGLIFSIFSVVQMGQEYFHAKDYNRALM